jgi:hypothetical protein
MGLNDFIRYVNKGSAAMFPVVSILIFAFAIGGLTIEMKTGVTKEGVITARKVRLIYDTGAYADVGPMAAGEGAKQAVGPYRIRMWRWIRTASTPTKRPPAPCAALP